MAEIPRRRLVLSGIFTLVLVGAVLGSLLGGIDLWLPMTIAAMPWFLILWARFNGPTAIGLTILSVLGVALFGLMATTLPRVSIVVVFIVLSLAVGMGGVAVVVRSVAPVRVPGSRMLAATGPLLGGVVWTVAVLLSRVLPGASAWGWVMNNDSANNLGFARLDLGVEGIQVGSLENPVPLPAGMLALGMSAGRGSVDSAHLLAHDLTAFIVVWGGCIALLCVLVGTLVSSMVSSSRPRVRWVVGALASLFPLSWYIVGYPIEFGFISTHVALVVVFAGWLVFRRLESRPALVWAALTLGCTLMLAIWSPLVLFPGSLLLVLLARSPRALWATSVRDRVIAIVGTAQLLLYGAFVSVPGYLAQSGFLAKGGAIYALSKWLFIVLVVGAMAVAVIARRRLGSLHFRGVVAAVLAALAGFGALVFAARDAPSPTTNYYPLKFEWIAGVILAVLVLAAVAGLVTRWWSGRLATAVALTVVTVGAATFSGLAPVNKTAYVRVNPVAQLLSGDFYGPHDEGARLILQYADRNSPTILWRSGRSDEMAIDFWVMQVQATLGPGSLALRTIAYGAYDVDKTADLCKVATLMDAPLRVVTSDSGLATEVSAECPAEQIVVTDRVP